MYIKIEVGHAVKPGMEKEALETVRQLSKKGSDHAACALWKALLLRGLHTESENIAIGDHDTEQPVSLRNFVNEPAKIKLLLSA